MIALDKTSVTSFEYAVRSAQSCEQLLLDIKIPWNLFGLSMVCQT